jgi:hypothetical protein
LGIDAGIGELEIDAGVAHRRCSYDGNHGWKEARRWDAAETSTGLGSV